MYSHEDSRLPERSLLAQFFARAAGWSERLGLLDGPFDAEDLIAAACRQTGLSSFGPSWSRDALQHLLNACREEAKLNALGRLALRQDIVRMLVNRLEIERDHATHPEITEAAVERPIFIVGLPRTGTTLLHNLLAQDPANRTPLTWEVMFPSPLSQASEASRTRRAQRNLDWLERLAPRFRAVHAVGAELPQECVAITSHAFLSDQFDTMFRVPSYQAWLELQDLSPAYAWHRRFLQHLQHRRSADRWVLKAPAHLWSLDALLAEYPDATIVQTHREPAEVLGSLASLTAQLRGVFSDHVDPGAIGSELAAYWARALDRAAKVRAARGPISFHDIPYSQLCEDPLRVIHSLYRLLDLPFSAEAESRMESFLKAHPREQHGRHRYELADFGLDATQEAARFSDYRAQFAPSLTPPCQTAPAA